MAHLGAASKLDADRAFLTEIASFRASGIALKNMTVLGTEPTA